MAAAERAILLRSPEIVRDALYEAERIAEITALEVQQQRDAIAADHYDSGKVGAKSRARMIRDAEHGRLTNAYALGHAFGRLAELRDQHRAAVRRVADLRLELAVWTRREPVGMVEIAAMLGYGADAPRQWKRRAILPTPAGSVSGTPYWWRPDVLRWAMERGRTRAILCDPVDAYGADSDSYGEVA